jgi:hypothetical protein
LITWLRSRGKAIPSRVFIHIGTHKTGTTSLQGFMEQNQRKLSRSGLWYPNAGRMRTPAAEEMSGHHNIAWEMNADPRYEFARGTFAQALDEIERRRARVAVLSSEDFEYLYRRPAALASMAKGIREKGFTASIVLYLRSQADYAQSLYSELVHRHGLDRRFDAFLAEIVSEGAFAYRDWAFCFDYDILARAFEEAFGPNSTIVRAYERDRTPDALHRDFVALIAPGIDFNRLRKPARLHEASSFIEVLESLYATIAAQRTIAPDPRTLAKELFPAEDDAYLAGRFDLLHGAAATAFQARFHESNEHIAARYGIRIAETSPDTRSHASEVREALFAAAMNHWGRATTAN